MRGVEFLAFVIAIAVASCSDRTYPNGCSELIAGWKKPSDGHGSLAVLNEIDVKKDGTLRWNGKPITEDELASFSSMLPTLNPIPFTILRVENGSPCSAVESARQIIHVRGQCMRSGWWTCGEGSDAWSEVWDVLGPNGEMYLQHPDGRVQTLQPNDEQKKQLEAARVKADDALDKTANSRL